MESVVSRELIEFISAELHVAPDQLLPSTRLCEDLGVDGADGADLIESFGRAFGVDLSRFEPALHFGPEAGFNPLLWLWSLVSSTRTRRSAITLADLQSAVESRRWFEAKPDAV